MIRSVQSAQTGSTVPTVSASGIAPWDFSSALFELLGAAATVTAEGAAAPIAAAAPAAVDPSAVVLTVPGKPGSSGKFLSSGVRERVKDEKKSPLAREHKVNTAAVVPAALPQPQPVALEFSAIAPRVNEHATTEESSGTLSAVQPRPQQATETATPRSALHQTQVPTFPLPVQVDARVDQPAIASTSEPEAEPAKITESRQDGEHALAFERPESGTKNGEVEMGKISEAGASLPSADASAGSDTQQQIADPAQPVAQAPVSSIGMGGVQHSSDVVAPLPVPDRSQSASNTIKEAPVTATVTQAAVATLSQTISAQGQSVASAVATPVSLQAVTLNPQPRPTVEPVASGRAASAKAQPAAANSSSADRRTAKDRITHTSESGQTKQDALASDSGKANDPAATIDPPSAKSQPASAGANFSEVPLARADVAAHGEVNAASLKADAPSQTAANHAPAASAPLPAERPDPVFHSAQLLDKVSQSELRLGMRTGEFGNVEIRTSIEHQQVKAEISSERGDLGGALATELPRLEQRMREQNVPLSTVVVHDANARAGSGADRGPRQQPLQPAPTPGSGLQTSTPRPVTPALPETRETEGVLDIRI